MAVWADFTKYVRSIVFKNELKNGDFSIKEADHAISADKATYAEGAGKSENAKRSENADWAEMAGRATAADLLLDVEGSTVTGTVSLGNESTPIYFSNGKPVKCHSFGMEAGQINVGAMGSARWNWDVASIYVFSVMLTEDDTDVQYAPTAVIYPVGYADVTKSTLITRGFSSEQFVISLETLNGVGYIRLRTLDGQNYQHAGTLNYLKIKLPIVAG